MPSIPKLVAFDLDDTLAESKQPITPEMAALLSQLLARVPVAVMSGGKWEQFMRQVVSRLPKHTTLEHLYLFPASAAQCYRYTNGAWHAVYDHSFTEEERQEIRAALHTALKDVGLDTPPPQLWGEQLEDRGAQFSFSPLGQQAPVAEKKAWREKHNPLRLKLRELLAQLLPDFEVTAGGRTTVDITRKSINKAYGVQQLADMTNIPVADMLYIGDALWEGGNDAVVIETSIPTHQVSGPTDTTIFILEILNSAS